MEKKVDSATKSRKTKLGKKSVEELVTIVLRKDDVERKLNKQIENYKKLAVLNDKRIETLKDTISKQEEANTLLEKSIVAKDGIITNLTKEVENSNRIISTYSNDSAALNNEIVNYRDKITAYRIAILVVIVAAIIVNFFI